jgi:hypothetical protein
MLESRFGSVVDDRADASKKRRCKNVAAKPSKFLGMVVRQRISGESPFPHRKG